MAPLVLLFVVLPVVELVVLVAAARTFGTPQALLALVLLSVVGAWLVKMAGLGVLRRLRATLARGDLPHQEMVDGVLLLVAGVLLFVPGFVTGAVGLFMLFPPTRALVRAGLISRFRLGAAGTVTRTFRGRGHVTVVDAHGVEVVDPDIVEPPGPDGEPPSLER